MNDRKPRATRSLMARAVDLLSRREHSRVQLARKLRPHLAPDESDDDIDRVLDRLQEQNLLSDARFAASLVRQRAARYGDLRLGSDLRERGVGAADASSAMSQVAGTEARRALVAWSRRFDALPTSADERGRQGRYLQTRGFSLDAITQVLAGKVPTDD
jgi:regulatory protein